MNALENALRQINQNMSIGTNSIVLVIFTTIMAFAVGLFIYWVYKKNYRGVMFSTNFALTLILMTVVTAPVVLCIRESVALSMGMVGALSIVRFRTAVKDPLDTAYMFWALTMGILLGAGQFLLAGITVVGIAVVIFVLRRLISKGTDSYLLVMRANQTGEANAQKLLSKVRYQALKSKTVTANGGIELTYEIRVEKSEAFLNKLLTLEGVKEASLVSYLTETV
ncbi:MAG: DUF4956 domain-containing protein [Clostridia bacterium]|nr:DUF4956 domain-containing protein [Clostridia bacterium]